MSNQFKEESGFAAVVAAFSFLIMVVSFRLGLGSLTDPGPGFFPFVVGFLALILSSVLLMFYLTNKQKVESSGIIVDKDGVKRVLGIIASLFGWMILMPWLGFIIVTFFVSFAFAKIMGLEKWMSPLLLSLGITLFVYLVFDVWFYLDLPRGLLG